MANKKVVADYCSPPRGVRGRFAHNFHPQAARSEPRENKVLAARRARRVSYTRSPVSQRKRPIRNATGEAVPARIENGRGRGVGGRWEGEEKRERRRNGSEALINISLEDSWRD